MGYAKRSKSPLALAREFELGSTFAKCRKFKQKSPSTCWPKGFLSHQVGLAGFEPTTSCTPNSSQNSLKRPENLGDFGVIARFASIANRFRNMQKQARNRGSVFQIQYKRVQSSTMYVNDLYNGHKYIDYATKNTAFCVIGILH